MNLIKIEGILKYMQRYVVRNAALIAILRSSVASTISD